MNFFGTNSKNYEQLKISSKMVKTIFRKIYEMNLLFLAKKFCYDVYYGGIYFRVRSSLIDIRSYYKFLVNKRINHFKFRGNPKLL